MATMARIQAFPQYVSDLRIAMGLYSGWIPNTYADQPTAENFTETLKNDPAVRHAVHLLSLMAAGEKYKIRCEDEQLKTALEFALKNIRDFTHARKSLVHNGVLYGLGIQRKYYKQVRSRKFPGLLWDVCYRMQEVDRRRLMIERNIDNKEDCYWCIWCPKRDQYLVLEDRSKNPNAEDGLGIQDYIFYIHEWEELSPYMQGLGDSLYALCYVKQKAIMYWSELAEAWARPFLVIAADLVKAAVTANLGDGFVSASKRVQDLMDAFEKARARHMVVVDPADKVEWHEHGSSGNNILRELIDYCDSKIQLLVLGAELTTGTASAGSYALGQIHRQQTDSIVQYNRMRLSEVIETDLLQDFVIRNWRNFYLLGMQAPEPGDVQIRFHVDSEDLQKQMMAAKGANGPAGAMQQKMGQQSQAQPAGGLEQGEPGFDQAFDEFTGGQGIGPEMKWKDYVANWHKIKGS